ncbi:biopolymer transporter ExbD, partial [Lacticaseibacillus rhamnosus]
MNLRTRNKIEVAFSMASMTDLIFLLLIFFMLTASFVTPSGLPVNLPTSSVVSCHAPLRIVSSWIVSIMRRMLFFDGRNARRAWPVLGEYIRPNVNPRKS